MDRYAWLSASVGLFQSLAPVCYLKSVFYFTHKFCWVSGECIFKTCWS